MSHAHHCFRSFVAFVIAVRNLGLIIYILITFLLSSSKTQHDIAAFYGLAEFTIGLI